MILLTTTQVDLLKTSPKKKVPYYDLFTSQYTTITMAAIISQTNLMPEMFGEDKEILDQHIDNFIKEIPERAKDMRAAYYYYCLGSHLDPGEIIQEKEPRVLLADIYTSEAKMHGISSRELTIRSLNAAAFLNYFFLIEDTIKRLYIKKYQKDRKEELGGKDIISKCLKTKLKNDKSMNLFLSLLAKRSKLFNSFESLESMWAILNFIRNRQVHYNGYFSNRSKRILKKIINDFYNCLYSEELLLSLHFLTGKFDNLCNQIDENNYILFNDFTENIIRNTSLFIMESLYLSEEG